MIKIVNGNIVSAKEQIIAHQVNCRGVMGAGLALQIRNKYSEVYEEYSEWWRAKYFNQGIYTSSYSRKVLDKANDYR